MSTIGEQLAKENQDLMKATILKTVSVIFKLSKDNFSKNNVSQSMSNYLKNPESFKIGESSIKKEFEKMNNNDKEKIEIQKGNENLSPAEVAELNNICNKNKISYEAIETNDHEYALVFESDNIENLELAFVEYIDTSREPLDFKLEKANNLLPEKENISLNKDLEL